jgi:MSHA biogenesis protein MshJ
MRRPALELPTGLQTLLVRLSARYRALSRRERWLVLGTLLVGIGALVDSALIEPMLMERRALLASIQESERKISELSESSADGASASTERVERAQKELASLDEALAAIRSSVIAPEQMAARLRELLTMGRGVTVVGFKNLAAVAVSAQAGSGGSAAASSGLYRHPVEVRLTGSYPDLVAWIDRIEREGQGLRLSKVSFDAQAGQSIQARIELYTLGTAQTWLTL